MNSNKESAAVWLPVLCLCLILVCLPRFNRNDFLIDRWSSEGSVSALNLADAGEYANITRWFRGELPADALNTPFSYRLFVPFVASLLPVDALSAINIINLLALLGALVVLYRILLILELPRRLQIAGCVLFVFSFPVFYYGTIGYVDAVLILFLMLGCLCVLREAWLPLALVLLVGITAKETVMLLLPVAAVRLYGAKASVQSRLIILAMLLLVSAAMYCAVRYISPKPPVHNFAPSLDFLLFNLGRMRTWLSVGLSIGMPGGILIVLLLRHGRKIVLHDLPQTGMFWAGLAMAVLLTAYSMLAAYTDGRFVWTAYPFLIPLLMLKLHRPGAVKAEEALHQGVRADVERSGLKALRNTPPG